jgi:iron complex outermembrane receptor protein
MKRLNRMVPRTILSNAICATTLLASTAQALEIEEIVVTAQKRSQSVQDVPIAINAFGGEELEASNIKHLNQVVSFTTGLSGQSQGFQGLETFSVRGISTSNFGVGGDLSVGVYLDGVYQPRNGASIAFFDMERVEILKGPQGLLFGRNATSGAISMITNKPSQEFEAEVSVGAEEREGNNFTGVINMPVGDDFAVRLAANHEETKGHVKNITTGRYAYGRNNDSVRLSGAYYGFENTDINVTLDYEDRESTSGEIFRWTTLLDEATPISTVPSLAPPSDLRESNNDFNGGEDWETWGGSVEIKTDLSNSLTLTSITGFRAHNYDYSEDFDGMPVEAFHYFQEQDGEYYSQEFRLSGEGDTITWFAGVSAYKENIDAAFTLSGDEDDICIGMSGFDCATIAGFTGDPDLDALLAAVVATPGTNNTDYTTISGENSGWAAFGDVTITFAENWDLSLGARYTYDKKEYTRNVLPANNPIVYLAGLNAGYATTGELSRDDSWSDFSPRIALTYRATEDVNVYATVSKGYKSGGFDSFGLSGVGALPTVLGGPAISDPNSLNSFDEETIISYEVGVKSSWLDNRLQLNASAYFYNYEDLQLIRRVGNAYVVSNVGEVNGQGLEMDLRFLPTDSIDFTLGISFLDTETDLTAEEEADVCGLPCSGGSLPYSPRWTVNSSVTYRIPVFDAHEFYTRLEYSYQDETYSELSNTAEIDDYEIINLRMGLESENWHLNLYAENLTDEETFNSNTETILSGISLPRTVGMEIGYRY